MAKRDRVETLSKHITAIDENIRVSFSKIKEEMEEHLQTINESTDEIQQNYEYLMDLEKKMDKLSEKVEQIQLMVKELLLQQIEITRLDDGKSMKLNEFFY